MKRARKLLVILFLLAMAIAMDTFLFILKKAKGVRFFPGG
jgi:hypothetical protein